MDCLTCEQLTADLELLEMKYATARGHLKDIAPTAIADRYNRAKAQAQVALLDCETAKIKLARHQQTHEKPPLAA